jgi:DNA polymerase Pol2
MEALAEVWDKHLSKIEEYCKYNLHDAKLTYELCLKMLPNMIELVKIVGLSVFDITRMGYSQLVEWYIIRQAPNFNEICMERPHYDEVRKRRTQTYKGAFVYEPKPGLYNDIVLFDFRSLYPTIIASHNISPGTLNCSCCFEKELAPTETGKYWFCKKKKGFIPTIIEDLITRRMRIKEMMAKEKRKDPMLVAREQSLKVLGNSFYGYLGFFNARWYSIESARSVTAWGRYYIKQVIDKAQEEGFRVIYGDTDSVFLTLDSKKTEDAVKFVEKINMTLPGVMELEFEGHYPSGIFVSAKVSEAGAKKKYALLNDEGDIEIKGFETVRRNWSSIAKDAQRNVLDIILKENNPEKALQYVKKVIADLREHKVQLDKVVIHTQLQKEISEYATIGPHVAAAQLMKKKGIPVGPGTLIKFVVAKGTGKIREKVKLVDDVKQTDYDPEYYINHQVVPSVERIFHVLGYKKEEITDHEGQKKLGHFI